LGARFLAGRRVQVGQHGENSGLLFGPDPSSVSASGRRVQGRRSRTPRPMGLWTQIADTDPVFVTAADWWNDPPVSYW